MLATKQWTRRARSNARLPAHLPHAAEDDGAVAVHALGAALEGSGENGGKAGRLLAVDGAGRSFVVKAACGVGPVDARAPLDQVEIQLEYAALAQNQFGDRDQGGLSGFAEDGAVGSEEEVFDELLGKCGASAGAVALQILLGGKMDGVPVEAVVVVEAGVLGGNDGVLEVGRDLAEGNEVVALIVRGLAKPGLDAALDVHGGGGRVDPACGDQQERGRQPKQRQSQKRPAEESAQAAAKRGLGG